MAHEIDDAIEQLITYLKEISEFKDNVFDGEPQRIIGQTAGIMLNSATISNFGGSSCMELHLVTVRVYIPMKDPEDVEESMREAWKDVRNKLFTHQGLNTNAQQALPTSYRTAYQTISGTACRIMDITVEIGLRPVVTYAT